MQGAQGQGTYIQYFRNAVIAHLLSQCDEQKPKCRSCSRRATTCTYSNNAGLNQLVTAAQVNRPETRSNTPCVQHNHAHGALLSNGNSALHPDGPSPLPPPSALTLNMAHLQLMHHFITVTFETLDAQNVSREAWKSIIPQTALSHDFLMHSILAVAALHIAHLRPHRRTPYWEQAAIHQDRAVELQQDAMANANPDNADALFAFSLLAIYFAFASPKASGRQESEEPLASAVQCISVIRGIRNMVPYIQQWVEAGPLSHLLSLHTVHAQSSYSFNDINTDRYFEKFLLLCSTSSDLNKPHEFEDIEQYAAAASTLRASFLTARSVEDGAQRTPHFWHWASRLPPEFVQRLGKLHPISLVLVAHWCVILAQVRQYWWIEGWVGHTMRQIRDHLPMEYHKWLEWPTNNIREQQMDSIARNRRLLSPRPHSR